MATPTMVTVIGRLVATAPSTGDTTARVTIEYPQWMSHADGTTIEPGVYTAEADANGNISMVVPATTDPAWTPTGYTVRVTFDGLEGMAGSKSFRALIPHNAPGGVVTLGYILPVAGSEGSLYAPLNHTHAELSPRFANLGEFVVSRGEIITSSALQSGTLFVTHFTALRTEVVTKVRTSAATAGVGGTHAWVGFLNWDGTNYTPHSQSADVPTLWSAQQAYDTPISNFSKVLGQQYAFFVLWIGGGAAPTLPAGGGWFADSLVEPRVNGQLFSQTAPPSGTLSGAFLGPDSRRFQGLMLR